MASAASAAGKPALPRPLAACSLGMLAGGGGCSSLSYFEKLNCFTLNKMLPAVEETAVACAAAGRGIAPVRKHVSSMDIWLKW